MKKKVSVLEIVTHDINQKLSEIHADIKAFESEYPASFPIMTDYKVMVGKRELLTELFQIVKPKI